ncbi:MAG: hypothetical protein ACKVX7_14770 [Planctomycetota bacterium]
MVRRSRSPLAEMLVGNWRNKLFALLLAVVVWGFAYQLTTVRMQLDFSVSISAPAGVETPILIVSRKVARGKSPGADFTGVVSMTLKGQQGELQGLKDQPTLTGHIVLPPLSNGLVDLLEQIKVDLPPGIEVVAVEPQTVQCELDREVVRKLKVRPVIKGTPDGPLVLRETRVEPEEIAVVGPERWFAQELQLSTEEIRVDGVQELERTFEGVRVPAPAVADLKYQRFVGFSGRLDPVLVRVVLLFENTSIEETLPSLPIKYASDPDVSVIDAVLTLREPKFRGAPAAIAELKKRIAENRVKICVLVKPFAPQPVTVERDELEIIGLPEGVELVETATIVSYRVKDEKAPTEDTDQ